MSLRDFLTTPATRTPKPALQVVLSRRHAGHARSRASCAIHPIYGHSAAYLALRSRIHAKLLERFDLAALDAVSVQTLQQEIAGMTERLLEEDSAASTIWKKGC
jgi:pilus assembly protein CpaF